MVQTTFSKDYLEDLKTFSYHEAGHAVLRAAAGFDVLSITLNERRPLLGFCGKTVTAGAARVKPGDEDILACPLGGYATTLILFDNGELSSFKDKTELLAWFSQGTGGDADEYFTLIGQRCVQEGHSDYYHQLQRFHKAALQIAVPRLDKLWPNVADVATAVQNYVKPLLKSGKPDYPIEVHVSRFKQYLP